MSPLIDVFEHRLACRPQNVRVVPDKPSANGKRGEKADDDLELVEAIQYVADRRSGNQEVAAPKSLTQFDDKNISAI